MSGRLVGETVEWLRTPAAQGLSQSERCILMVIAERAHERSRVMLRHRTDEEALIDRIAGACELDKEGGLKRAFQRLAKRGLEVRVAVKFGKDGRPVFAHEGVSMGFRLPEFPASVELPTGGTQSPPSSPVDNSPVTPLGDHLEGGRSVPALASEEGLSVPTGGTQSPPLSPSSTSKTFYPSGWIPSSVVAVEGAPAGALEDDENPIDQAAVLAAFGTLLGTPDGGISFLATASAEHPGDSRERQIVHAARLARRPA